MPIKLSLCQEVPLPDVILFPPEKSLGVSWLSVGLGAASHWFATGGKGNDPSGQEKVPLVCQAPRWADSTSRNLRTSSELEQLSMSPSTRSLRSSEINMAWLSWRAWAHRRSSTLRHLSWASLTSREGARFSWPLLGSQL